MPSKLVKQRLSQAPSYVLCFSDLRELALWYAW